MADEARLMEIGEKVAGQVLGLRQGETLCIVRDAENSGPLAAAIARAAMQAGAEPVQVMMVPRTVGGQELPPTVAGALERSSACVNLARWALAHTRAGTATLQAGGRMCDIRSWEISLDSPGMTADYEEIRRNALAVDALLEQARDVRVTTAEGTDFTLQFCGRKGKAQTGFAHEPGSFSGLPDGESTVAPLEGTTQGRIVAPYVLDKIGLVDEPFEMEIRDGWIVSVEGGKQARELNELFEEKDPNARRIASQFALGINPGCMIVPHSREVSKRLGTIHVAMGDNFTLGGTVQSGIHIDITILNPTVTLDGKLLLKDCKLYL